MQPDSARPADPTGDHAFTDTVDGHTDAESPLATMPLRARLVFLAVVTAISLLLYGVGSLALLPPGVAWPAWVVWGGRAVLLVAALALPALTVLANRPGAGDGLGRTSHVMLGVGWLLLVWGLLALVLGHLPMTLAGVGDPTRGRVTSLATLTLVVGLAAYGMYEALRVPRVRRVDIPVRGLPPGGAGLTVAVLTDTHFDAWTSVRWSRAVTDRVNELGADVVVHTGDLADGSVRQRGEKVATLADIVAPQRFYIAGNHEYYSGPREWTAFMGSLGWRVLVNQHEVLEAGLVVAGTDDPTGHDPDVPPGTPGRGPDLDAALAGTPAHLPVLLLAHQPHQIRASAGRVDLQVSGHTHGGQMWPFHYLVRLREPVVQGLSRHGERTHLWTSRGTGFWGPPFRIFAPSEISLLRLVPA